MIGMRSEDLHRCALYIDLPNVINQASFLTRRLDDDEIASAIIEPMRLILRLRGIRPARFKPIEVDPWPFDVELLRRLYKAVSSLSYNPDHLPLLQHLLSVLWRHIAAKYVLDGDKTGNGTAAAASIAITSNDLAAALGFSSIDEMDAYARRNKLPDSWILGRALDHAAEGVMPSQDRLRRITEIMFRLLAEEDDQGIYSRRWTTRQEIADVAGTHIVAKPKRLHALWQRLRGRARVVDDDRPATDVEIEEVIKAFTSTYPFLHLLDGREGNIDVSHEAFIRNWKTFGNWLQKERSLASAFGVVRSAYERWLEKARDPHWRWFGLRAMFGARLRTDKLREVRSWWKERRNSLAWAVRYAKGANSEDPDSRTRQPAQIGVGELRGWRDWWHEWRLGTGEAERYAAATASQAPQSNQPQQNRIDERTLQRLRRYHRQSFYATWLVMITPWLLLGIALISVVAAFENRGRAATSETQLAAFKPYRIAQGIEDSFRKAQGNLDTDEEHVKAATFAGAKALQMLEDISQPGLADWYRIIHMKEADPGDVYSVAAVSADKAARTAMAFALWPEPMTSSERAMALDQEASASKLQSMSGACQAATQEVLKKLQENNAAAEAISSRHTLAPLEPHDGKRLLMVQSPASALNFFLMSENGKCQVERLATVTIPTNSEVLTDPELRLIAVNEKRGGQYEKTWLYRVDWIRKCKDNEAGSPCNVEFYPDMDWSLHGNGPYRVLDSSHVIAGEKRYRLRRDYKPTLLGPQEAAAFTKPAVAESDKVSGNGPSTVLCDPRGPYMALLTTEEGKRQKSGRQFDVLKIVPRKEQKQCPDYVSERSIMSFDLAEYSIGSFAIPKGSPVPRIRDHIYLQGQEGGVVYELVWNPADIKSMLCEILHKQDYMPTEVCEKVQN